MASFKGTTRQGVDAQYVQALTLQTPSSTLGLEWAQVWTSGTGDNQANRLYTKSIELVATTDTLDLNGGGLTDGFGNTLAFAKVKELWIRNKSAVAGETLTVSGNFMSSLGNGAAEKATGTLTLALNVANTETVVIDGKTYTYQTSLTDSDGNVLIGGSASASLDNLIAAINLQVGSGTEYAASTTIHSTVTALAGAGDTMDITAKTAGTAGNSIATTETLAGSGNEWGAGTMSGGSVSSQTINIGPGGSIRWADPIDGLTVTAGTADTIIMDSGAKTFTYEIVIIGT